MYLIDFNIAATFLSLVTAALYRRQPKAGTRRDRQFATLICVSLAASVFGIASSLAINALPSISSAAVLACSTIFYLLHHSVPPIIAAYVLTESAQKTGSRKLAVLFLFPWCVSVALILTNPLTHALFLIDSSGIYRHGPLHGVLYALICIYGAICLGTVVMHLRFWARARQFALYVWILFGCGALLLQMAHPYLMIECFAVSLGVLFIFLAMQSAGNMTDGQTGAFTHSTFPQILAQFVQEGRRFPLLVVRSADIPDLRGVLEFRSYRDFVRSYTSWLCQQAGKKSSVFSLGEGLFAVIPAVRQADSDAGSLALELISNSGKLWQSGSVQIELSVQVGILRFPDDFLSVPDAVDRISQVVKVSGEISNRHVFYASDLVPGMARRKAEISDAVRKAVKSRNIDLLFQPIHSVRGKKITGLEVLVGVSLTTGEWVRQSEVLEAANMAGLSIELCRLMIELSAKWYIGNRLESLGVNQLQVRLVDSWCMSSNWDSHVLALISACGIKNERVCLEITETCISSSGPYLASGMASLTQAGITFAIDDYGTGYTDLGQMLDMPFSLVKFDKKIIYTGIASRKGQQLLSGSIGMFRSFGQLIVAEGIETAEQAETLSWAGCDFLQGYHFGRPASAEETLLMLRAGI